VVKVLRVVAATEAITLIALIASVIVYRGFDGHDWTPMLGPIHGITFVAYGALTVHVGTDLDWPLRRTVAVIFAAVIPAAGFVIAERLTPVDP
jgi:integral membrane protein